MTTDARNRFLALLHDAVENGTFMKLTLGKYRGADASLRNLFVRPVALRTGPHLTFLWRHATRDVTKNHPPADALAQIDSLLGRDFLDAHLFTTAESAQLETQPDGSARLRTKAAPATAASAPPNPPPTHDRPKTHAIAADAPWLRALGVTNDRGRPREGMADKFRQIQKFAELLTHLLAEAALSSPNSALRILDAGSGKGYLTFALADLLRDRAHITGIEARPELVEFCNRTARDNHFNNLTFTAGQIADQVVDRKIENRESKIENPLDVLIALHACDTATDVALAHGIAAGAQLLVVAPCCQKELRRQLTAPPVLAEALRHGIFQERQAEFVTDALRAQLLEWAGYRTKVFEFISTEHTAKNLMIAAIKSYPPADTSRAQRVRAFAAFYGIRAQRLAQHLHFPLHDAPNLLSPIK
jgi:SAM-dependent methyltransferase